MGRGDGGPRHTDAQKVLLAAGANPNLCDRDGRSPRARGYLKTSRLLLQPGTR